MDQLRPRLHQFRPRSDDCQVRFRFRTPVPDRPQHLRIDPRQPRQLLRIHPIVLPVALADQLDPMRVRYDRFVSRRPQAPALSR